MIKCYYTNCKKHSKYEPFCNDYKCTATDEELKVFVVQRVEFLKSVGQYNNQIKDEHQ